MSASAFRIVLPTEPTPPENQLRLFEPAADDPPRDDWTLRDFFHRWYVPAVRSDRRRAPISDATIARRSACVQWFSRVMADPPTWPDGPPLAAITESTLLIFQDRLRHAEFSRGPNGSYRRLADITRQRTIEECLIVLAAAGPRNGRLLRAGVLPDPPSIFVERAPTWSKQYWSLAEGRRIFAAIDQTPPIQPRSAGMIFSGDVYRRLARATVGLWFYTGHRAGTYCRVRWRDCRPEETADGRVCWFLFVQSIKTRKPDKVAIHPHLVDLLDACRGIDDDAILPWPICYSAIRTQHAAWQKQAGLSPLRTFGPQAWRRTHLAELHETGYSAAKELLRDAAGHSSSAITESHYFSIRNAHLLKLPRLDVL